MTCGKKSTSSTAKAYNPAKKNMVHRNAGNNATKVSGGGFGTAKVTARFSGRSR